MFTQRHNRLLSMASDGISVPGPKVDQSPQKSEGPYSSSSTPLGSVLGLRNHHRSLLDSPSSFIANIPLPDGLYGSNNSELLRHYHSLRGSARHTEIPNCGRVPFRCQGNSRHLNFPQQHGHMLLKPCIDSTQPSTTPLSKDKVDKDLVRSDTTTMESRQAFGMEKVCHRKSTGSEPGDLRNRRRRSEKAKAQYTRDRSFYMETPAALWADGFPLLSAQGPSPKRKQCALVQEQESKCLFEDRVGTPHLSELQPGDDVNALHSLDELSVGGEVAALSTMDGAAQGLSQFDFMISTFPVTDIPSEDQARRD